MKSIETIFGTFEIGEEVTASRTGLLGEVKMIVGTVEGSRRAIGTDYLIIKTAEGYIYDLPLKGGDLDYIVKGNQIDKPVEGKGATSSYNRVK